MGRKVISLQALSSKSLERVIRNACDRNWDPMCHELEALSQDQKKRGVAIREYVAEIPVAEIDIIFRRVMSYDGESEAKASPMDIWVLIHPLTKSIIFQSPTKEPIRGIQKALLESLHRCKYLEFLDINSMAVKTEFRSNDCREFYLSVLEDALKGFDNLSVLNVGNMINNSICKTLSENCSNLKQLHASGPNGITDLGLRYIIGQIPSTRDNSDKCDATNEHHQNKKPQGCFKLQVLSLKDMENIFLRCLVVLILHLPHLKVLDHDKVHEALLLMERTEMMPDLGPLQLTSYHGRTPEGCATSNLEIVQKLCPNLEFVHLCTTFEDTFIPLARLRMVHTLILDRVASLENFDLPLMAFGIKLVKLELKACNNFHSGTALHIRKFCPNLKYLSLEIDTTAPNSQANPDNLAGGDGGNNNGGQQNIWALQNQVDDLQSKLNKLQVTMLSVMDKYGPMADLEVFKVRNLSMGSILILLPFMPNVRVLAFKYTQQAEESASNITDDLFRKIFKKNEFKVLEELSLWSGTVGAVTADWFLNNAPKLKKIHGLTRWDISDEERMRIWREGRNRNPEIEIEL